LQGILDEETAANEALNERAHATSNTEALGKPDEAGTSLNKSRAKTPAVRGEGRAGKSNHSRIESLA
jgi:hypothetical protein